MRGYTSHHPVDNACRGEDMRKAVSACRTHFQNPQIKGHGVHLTLGGHHGLRWLGREGVFTGRLLLIVLPDASPIADVLRHASLGQDAPSR